MTTRGEVEDAFKQSQAQIKSAIDSISRTLGGAVASYVKSVKSAESSQQDWQSALQTWEARFLNPGENPDKSQDSKIRRKLNEKEEEYILHLNLIAKKRQKLITISDLLVHIGQCLSFTEEKLEDCTLCQPIAQTMTQLPEELRLKIEPCLRVMHELENLLTSSRGNWDQLQEQMSKIQSGRLEVETEIKKLNLEISNLNDELFLAQVEIKSQQAVIKSLNSEISRVQAAGVVPYIRESPSPKSDQDDNSAPKVSVFHPKEAEMMASAVRSLTYLQEAIIKRERKLDRLGAFERDIDRARRKHQETNPNYQGGKLGGKAGEKIGLVDTYRETFAKDHQEPIFEASQEMKTSWLKTQAVNEKWLQDQLVVFRKLQDTSYQDMNLESTVTSGVLNSIEKAKEKIEAGISKLQKDKKELEAKMETDLAKLKELKLQIDRPIFGSFSEIATKSLQLQLFFKFIAKLTSGLIDIVD